MAEDLPAERRRWMSTMERWEIFLPENICMKNEQNARILHDNCPKNVFPIFGWVT